MNRLLRIVPGLAVSDLRHEWILTLCLVLAVSAVVAPLLILMGLKHGTIATLRERLVEDPAYREIRPMETQEYGRDWFEKWQSDPRVGFLLPTILPASSVIQAVPSTGGKPLLLDLLPSAEGDPLMHRHGAPAPGEGEAVLTAEAARLLAVSEGDEIEVRATRRRNGRAEYGSAKLKITAVLPASAGTLARMYTSLQMVLDVERYKEGMSVASRKWPGSVPRPYATLDGVLLLAQGGLDPLLHNALLIESGLAEIRSLEAREVEPLIGHPLAAHWEAYLFTVPGNSVSWSSYKAVKQKMRGQGAVVLPLVQPLQVQLEGKPQTLLGLSLSERVATKLGLPATPWGGLRRRPAPDHLLQVLLPESLAQPQGAEVSVRYAGRSELVFPLKVRGTVPEGRPLMVPLELAAILRTARNRRTHFDVAARDFRLEQAGYRGFRLYARSIDDVPELAEALKSDGVPVIAEVEAIRRIQVLDSGLSRLFWLIAILGVGGGTAVLIASLYASVERKRRDLAMMRLIGFSRADLFALPVVEGLLIAAGGLATALLAYLVLASVINRVFVNEMAQNERICSLPPSYVGGAVILTLVVAAFSSLFAATKATRIDPADAIREE